MMSNIMRRKLVDPVNQLLTDNRSIAYKNEGKWEGSSFRCVTIMKSSVVGLTGKSEPEKEVWRTAFIRTQKFTFLIILSLIIKINNLLLNKKKEWSVQVIISY